MKKTDTLINRLPLCTQQSLTDGWTTTEQDSTGQQQDRTWTGEQKAASEELQSAKGKN